MNRKVLIDQVYEALLPDVEVVIEWLTTLFELSSDDPETRLGEVRTLEEMKRGLRLAVESLSHRELVEANDCLSRSVKTSLKTVLFALERIGAAIPLRALDAVAETADGFAVHTSSLSGLVAPNIDMPRRDLGPVDPGRLKAWILYEGTEPAAIALNVVDAAAWQSGSRSRTALMLDVWEG